MTQVTGVRGSFALIESMRAERGCVPLMHRHLDRLTTSAKEFGFQFDLPAIERELTDIVAPIGEPAKVRAELASDGKLSIGTTALNPLPDNPGIVLANNRLDSRDMLLRHKTTRRDVYERERRRLASMPNGVDVIFLNERDELCEGAITNIFVEVDGQIFTPPVHCGLLSGVMRAVTIAETGAVERVLTLSDLRGADRVILTNAVRGRIEVAELSDAHGSVQYGV